MNLRDKWILPAIVASSVFFGACGDKKSPVDQRNEEGIALSPKDGANRDLNAFGGVRIGSCILAGTVRGFAAQCDKSIEAIEYEGDLYSEDEINFSAILNGALEHYFQARLLNRVFLEAREAVKDELRIALILAGDERVDLTVGLGGVPLPFVEFADSRSIF